MPSNGREVVQAETPATTNDESRGAANTPARKGKPVEPEHSIPDPEAEERATYYTLGDGLVAARSVPADSGALYEAVNAWVETHRK